MSNGFEISGSIVTLAGAIWLSIDALSIRRHIMAEAGASKLLEILEEERRWKSIRRREWEET